VKLRYCRQLGSAEVAFGGAGFREALQTMCEAGGLANATILERL
jgi:hypothetical protein